LQSVSEVTVNFVMLETLARARRNDLLQEAAVRRSLVTARPRRPVLRFGLARALRAFGTLAVTLGDALAERP